MKILSIGGGNEDGKPPGGVVAKAIVIMGVNIGRAKEVDCNADSD